MYIDILHEAIEALWIENKVMRNELEKERELQRKERKRELEIAKKETLEREAKLFLQNTKVTYSGSRNLYRIKHFSEEILLISENFELDDRQLIIIAGRNMTGRAKIWFNEHTAREESQSETFDQFIQALELQFSEEYDTHVQFTKLLNLRQIGKVSTFNNNFDELLEKLPSDYFSEEAKLLLYLTKLGKVTKKQVNSKKPTSLSAAKRFAVEYGDTHNNS
ncbi:DEHA2C06776p [Debaryomyces hansenii CBS767]|jgi:hypothetical protein|uniref:DEHA2C06776p n=1 Tax=Debaryomyces hansenii (strain ATCC 36239 / CBS 767 / BCRC 21394 / JCM 1990 / NBRC 0083 / IGC 2968) TaxID=284592 RepID=Q6BUZ1_DEBHA|nr:DEHA2C06776p [Debaryomyces hansenii CBS767]CAG86036.1 DEHA2C06776p [Debaryomyces hansenii CBS767]|eukprot:XP_457978.1 DEHA2C06776p [Debaryomyces hansenii CBS767]